MSLRRISRRAFLSAMTSAVLAAACSSTSRRLGTPTLPAPTPAPSSTPATATPLPDVSLDEKIARMVMAGFRGLTVAPGDPIAHSLARGLGGTVLFDIDVPTGSTQRNIESPQQLAALTAALQSLASPPPLLIATDEEGGNVARLNPSHGFPATLSEGELGRRDDVSVTQENARTIAGMLSAAGINLDLAPVVDLNRNPDNPIIAALDRSYSADPDVVTRHALATIGALHEQRILTTLKHFPGHGSSTADSHLGFVDVTATWSRVELEPFANIVAAGQADAVMTAHIFNANLDPDYPATLSRATITGILREELGFDGVVITDDMQMAAISEYYAFDNAVRLAVLAGADIIAIANNSRNERGTAEEAMQVIRSSVDSGAISPDRIDESYRRITALKARLS